MLTVENLHAGYGASEVLRGISLQVKQGTVVALIGANGAGKTTTMRALSGLLQPTQGRVMLNGIPVQGYSAAKIARQGLAHSPEGRKVFGSLSVEDNLLLGGYSHLPKFFGYRAQAAPSLEKIYQLFPRLHERATQTAGTLSGGEQQMLTIGRALMANPKVMLLDEPSMGLAPVLVETIFRTVIEINREGTTILLVEQNASMALQVASRGYVLESGAVALEASAKELRESDAVRRTYLGIE